MLSTVYFSDLHTSPGNSLIDKVKHLLVAAGINNIDFDKKFTAIKIHFGEPGNLAYLRPNYAAEVVRQVKKRGGIPYLTDCNTLYSGRRSNAPSHLEAAFENGYNPLATDCPVIIADGVKGTDYREITIDKECCQSAKIGSAIADADIIISMSHFKGHDLTGFGGTLKNLGMGCASVSGKLFLHSTSTPSINHDNCIGCGFCKRHCAQKAIEIVEKKAYIDYDKCVGCGECIAVCQYDAAQVAWHSASEDTCKRIAEYSYAVVKDKPAIHLSFMVDVSPNCDCWAYNQYPLVPNIGIAASTDPVALDQACVDMVKSASALPESMIYNHEGHGDLCGEDKFIHANPNTHWEAGLKHAEAIGLGSTDYIIQKV